MDRLDHMVMSHLTEKLLQPERMAEMLSLVIDRRAGKAAAVDARAAALEREAADADERLRRLYRLVEDGAAEFDGALKERIATLRASRDAASAALARLARPADATRLTSDLIDRFTATMRDHVTTGEIGFRKAYIRSVVDRVEVDDREVRVLGRKDVLEQGIMAGAKPAGAVRSFVRGWLGD